MKPCGRVMGRRRPGKPRSAAAGGARLDSLDTPARRSDKSGGHPHRDAPTPDFADSYKASRWTLSLSVDTCAAHGASARLRAGRKRSHGLAQAGDDPVL